MGIMPGAPTGRSPRKGAAMANEDVKELEHIDAPRRPKGYEKKYPIKATKVVEGVKYSLTKDIIVPRFDPDLKQAIEARGAETVFVDMVKSLVIDEQKVMRDEIERQAGGGAASGRKRGLKASDFAA